MQLHARTHRYAARSPHECFHPDPQVNGTTLWLDYSFPAFPENMGHWLEMLLPVYSQLSSGEWRAHVPPGEQATVGAVIVPNMRRGQITVGAEAGDARASGA